MKRTKEIIKKTMKAIRSSGSSIELKLAKELWQKGYRYRKNVKTVFGKPDIAFIKNKIAIFVDSEFWHGKDWKIHKGDHKSNRKYWLKKIERNIERDKEVNFKLKSDGWVVLRFWGKDIERRIEYCVKKIEKVINEQRN